MNTENAVMPAATGEVFWRYEEPAPRGVKLLLLTSGGVAVIGEWSTNSNLVAWSPLPRRDKAKEHALWTSR